MQDISKSRKLGIRLLKQYDPNQYFSTVKDSAPYRIPKGYLKWEDLSEIIGASILQLDIPEFHQKCDLASLFYCNRAALWFVQRAPIYCLSNSLLRAFEQTNVLSKEKLFSRLNIPLPTFIMLFPQNSIIAPGGGVLDHVVVHLADEERPELSEGSRNGIRIKYLQHEHPINIHWASIDSKQVVWFSGTGIDRSGAIIYDDKNDLGMDPLTDEDRLFTNKIRSIVLQCILAIAYMPELLDEDVSLKQTRRYQQQGSSRPTLTPRWIGKNYKINKEQRLGSHASPQEHWRTGHYRLQPIGVGRQNSKLIWIQPTIVNAKL